MVGRRTKVLSRPAMKSQGTPNTTDNPFETIWSRRKFDVLGKKRRGEERRIALSRSQAIHKRKKTLLLEYNQSAKSSRFIDRRIGEQDDTLQEFDKAVLRLQHERMSKLKRASKYNLSDRDEDDPEVHQVQSLSEKDDFDEDRAIEGSDDEGVPDQLDRIAIHKASQTNLLEEEGDMAHKTKKEVMMEIISKSKFYKAQVAKEKEEDEHLMNKLDQDFISLTQTDALLSLTQQSKINAFKSLMKKKDSEAIHKDWSSGSTSKETFYKEKPDAYDKLVKEMVMDSRARPSDRTKTPEEIAQEERERLEKMEEERQKRMHGADESSDEGSDDGEDNPDTKLENSKSISGDALGDDFSLNESAANKKGWVDQIYENERQSNDEDATSSDENAEGDEEDCNGDGDDLSDEDDSSDQDFSNMPARDWEQSDDDVAIDGDGMEDVDEKKEVTGSKMVKADLRDLQRRKAAGGLPQGMLYSLPFVIEAPNNLEELRSLLDGRSETEIIEAINRIRTCNSIRLAAENRKKMQVFYGVLIQFFAVLATERPLKINIINMLVKPLIEMSAETPYFAAICAKQRLIHIRTQLSEDLKVPGKSSWPSLKTLLLLRLWSLTFPCSDFRHAVTTPMLLLMCEYMMRCPMQSGRDIAVGSFLCSMVLVSIKESRRFCPEAIIFLQTLLASSIRLKPGTKLNDQVNNQFVELKTMKPWLHVQNQVHEVTPMNILTAMDMAADSPYFSSDEFKASVLLSVAETLRGFVIIHEDLSSFPEIFLPISALLQGLQERHHLSGLLHDAVKEVIDLIKKKSDEHHMLRQPLQMLKKKQKPEPIKLLNPKFEENYIKGVDYDPDRERARMKKLKKRLKSEKKGAIRELRKDNYFLSGVKDTKRILEEQERAERYGKAMSFLQEQEHAFKSGQLGKGRKRRK